MLKPMTTNAFSRVAFLATATLMLVSGAWAQTPISGSTSGKFVNPQPVGAVTSGVGTNSFSWGSAVWGSAPSNLTFDGGPFASLIGQEFSLGTLSYHNGTIYSGTEATSVDLRVRTGFVNPNYGPTSWDYKLGLVNTPNITGTANGDADGVLLSFYDPVNSFTVNGTTYDVNILGFRNVSGDGLLASNTGLWVREGGVASAQLVARVSTRVPEPGTLALALLALPALAVARRRRK
jgi:hypothetical protein